MTFLSTTSNEKFYRLTDRSGNISYAKSTDGRNYNYINRNDEQSLFKSLELYESRMLGEKKSTKAILTSDNKTSSINPEQRQSTPLTAGIEKITDTAEISSKYRNIDFNKYNVFSYKEDNGSIGYALVPKTNTNSAGLCSIRNGRIKIMF